MIYIIQLLKMFNDEEIRLFVNLFDDLSFEIEEMGYEGLEDELINEMLANHLGVSFKDEKQLLDVTAYILKRQGQLSGRVRGMCLMMNRDVKVA